MVHHFQDSIMRLPNVKFVNAALVLHLNVLAAVLAAQHDDGLVDPTGELGLGQGAIEKFDDCR